MNAWNLFSTCRGDVGWWPLAVSGTGTGRWRWKGGTIAQHYVVESSSIFNRRARFHLVCPKSVAAPWHTGAKSKAKNGTKKKSPVHCSSDHNQMCSTTEAHPALCATTVFVFPPHFFSARSNLLSKEVLYCSFSSGHARMGCVVSAYVFFFPPLFFESQRSLALGLFYWAVSRHVDEHG